MLALQREPVGPSTWSACATRPAPSCRTGEGCPLSILASAIDRYAGRRPKHPSDRTLLVLLVAKGQKVLDQADGLNGLGRKANGADNKPLGDHKGSYVGQHHVNRQQFGRQRPALVDRQHP